ncbi:hypothetical protein V492_02242 [Pseudogymnoascus sp. VKM F-4246]|nr:hypothetical protein V492_02242 [Pseudogymnoascus sp. VKM F-4246]
MVQLPSGLTALSATDVGLYHTTDPLLSHLPLLIFHGASTTTNATLSSSRIQIHILSAAGFTSYPRLTVSPNSPLYEVVNELPREWQGDEVCRGLAFGLMKYFEEMPPAVKTALIVQSSPRGRRPGSVPTLFGRQHAANLASSLVKVDNVAEVIADLEIGIQSQAVSHVDVDLVLPPGSINSLPEVQPDDMDDEAVDSTYLQYGPYAPLVRQFGEPAFIPTSKLRRAPSKPTSLNRSKSFLKNQKMSLRREMGELVDTEERYVIKVHELVNNIADEFRSKARTKAIGSTSPTEKDLQKLFPPSLDKILQVNKGFLAAVQKCMDESEEEAMQDLENDQPAFSRPRYGGTGRPKDPTGATGFAKVLLEWFPQFADCYQDYIRASQDFPQLISTYARQQSSFSQRVQQTGEQKLRSSVIEPVQRLPRYSLFIDNIVNYLPLTHPALQSMLKARDIITSICSLDSPDADNSQTVKRLKLLVDKWPTCVFKGRLISAVDFVELAPPYHTTANTLANTPGILLLFAETLIVCRKAGGSSISARGVMAEIDKPSTASMVASVTGGEPRPPPELHLVSYHILSDIRFTEGQDGRVTWMTLSAALDKQPNALPTKRAFLLQGSYEGKASKWTDEFTKARVEGRFAEKERESDKWSLRNVSSKETGLNIYAAVFEEGIDTLVEGRKEPAPIRIVVDHERGTKGAPVGHYGVESVVNVTVIQGKTNTPYHLKFEGLNDRTFNDLADDSSFMSTFAKRVETLLQIHYSAKNPALTTSFILCYSSILNALNLQLDNDKAKYQRAPSPVKMLSSFLTGGGSSSSDAPKHKRTPTLGSIPSFTAPSLSRSSSKKEMDSIVTSTNSSFKASFDEPTGANPLVKLEETFTGYIIALQSRKGNIIGRVLRNRAGADELSVNALYNKFIENPFDARASFEATIDVLFSAFEKFTRMAWKDQMGPVISVQTLQGLQEKASKLFPGDFADYIKLLFGDMAPQNRRAFVAIIKLLADLLEGCGNDGDRGALTASFAELLVPDNNPHSYINLLDRLVEDADRLFEDLGVGASTGYNTPMDGSMTSRTQGSVTSNTSLRKRFGLDSLLRQNSKREDDSKPSMWRTLSKTARSTATGEQMDGSISKGRLHRSRSIESDSRLGTPKRPGSRDRPTVLGAFAFDDQRPSSSHTPSRLSTIGQSPPPATDTAAEKSLKKKRRSSLSDLKALLANATLDSPATPLSTRRANQLAQPTQASPRTPSPTKLPSRALAFNGSPKQKENANPRVSPARNIGNLTERPHNVQSSDTVTIKDLWAAAPSKSPPKSAANLASNIPTLKGSPRPLSMALAPVPVFGTPAFSEITNPRKEAGPTNIPSPTKSPQKLRLQSPQKLRERLQNEAKDISEAEAGLQSELAKIGAEMARLSGSPVRGTPSTSGSEVRRISESVRALESRIPVLIKDLEGRNAATQKELDRGLVVAEEKAKGLDQLYREVSAENEILYERFNGELGRIVKALKGKGREEREELVKKVKESSEEAAAVRKENARLKREVAGLKALMKASAL